MSTDHIGHKFNFTAAFTEAVVPVGTVYTVRNAGQTRKYVFLYNEGADSAAAGDVCACFTAASFTFGSFSVTTATEADMTDGSTTRALVAGIAGATIATTQWGWLWFAGYGVHSITTDTNIAVYNELILADGAKLATPNTTAATAHWQPFGIALAADSGSALTKAVLGGSGMFRWDA